MIRHALAAMREPRTAVEVFITGNLAFLAADIYVAHSVNAFQRREEWIPLAFSLVAPLLLLAAAFLGGRGARALGLVVGWTSLAVGVAGMLYHLESHFFEEQTLRNLVYTAPFVAPLSYAGLGLLLILDRTEDARSPEWGQWVIVLALGGFLGNFVLSVCDHAQNGFFNRWEWLPVGSSAVAIGFLALAAARPHDPPLRTATWCALALQFVIGIAGFAFHALANAHNPAPRIWDRFLYGAPIFAPLLFPNLAILAGLGLWAVAPKRA